MRSVAIEDKGWARREHRDMHGDEDADGVSTETCMVMRTQTA